jgi:translation initiation factor 2B subunit (eIF-2B alpha/beta/delta family)
MTKMQTTMTENMAKNDAADAAMKAHMDSQQAGTKSDMEMKHAIIAQLQAMSDQIQQMNERITAISAQMEATAKPVKAVKSSKPAAPAARPPIKPVY